MAVWDINFNVSTWQALPVRLRQVVMYAWMKVCVRPVVMLAELFARNRAANRYIMAHNGQVCYLEAALNDTFDVLARGIFISDPVFFDPMFLYRRNELKPVYLYRRSESLPVFMYRRSECYTDGGVQFVVHVPVAVYGALDVNHLRALVNFYRLASKQEYIIVTY